MIVNADQVLLPGHSYAIHFRTNRNDWAYPLHGHAGFCELLTVISGTVRHQVNGVDQTLGPGDLLLIRADDRHALAGRGFLFYNLNLPLAEWDRVAAYLGDPAAVQELLRRPVPPHVRLAGAEARQSVAQLQELFHRQRDPGARLQLAPWLAATVGRFLAAAPPLAHADPEGLPPAIGQPPPPSWLAEAMVRAEAKLEDGIDVAGFVRVAGCSPAHFSRSMRRHLGCTPSAWLDRRRTERAALLLAHTDRPLLDIALGLGFGSASYFHRRFKAVYGRPPAAWRREHALIA